MRFAALIATVLAATVERDWLPTAIPRSLAPQPGVPTRPQTKKPMAFAIALAHGNRKSGFHLKQKSLQFWPSNILIYFLYLTAGDLLCNLPCHALFALTKKRNFFEPVGR